MYVIETVIPSTAPKPEAAAPAAISARVMSKLSRSVQRERAEQSLPASPSIREDETGLPPPLIRQIQFTLRSRFSQ